jgi:hypothetical protein
VRARSLFGGGTAALPEVRGSPLSTPVSIARFQAAIRTHNADDGLGVVAYCGVLRPVGACGCITVRHIGDGVIDITSPRCGRSEAVATHWDLEPRRSVCRRTAALVSTKQSNPANWQDG